MSKEELQVFVPALVYTLYDGYYIYTKYDNMYPEKQVQYIPILRKQMLIMV